MKKKTELIRALNWFDDMVEEMGINDEEREYKEKLYKLLKDFIKENTK